VSDLLGSTGYCRRLCDDDLVDLCSVLLVAFSCVSIAEKGQLGEREARHKSPSRD
jgi:hypothetical protein